MVRTSREVGLGGRGTGECIRLGPMLVPHQHDLSPPVLPSFEVQLEPEEKFYYIDDPDGLKINIIAR